MRLVSIVVLNWNGKDYIRDCLNSIKQQTYPNYETIVVDNNSTDQSVEIIKKFQNIKLIKNKKNLGFAEGNNVGIKQSKGDYIILLNMDTVTDKDWLRELIKVAESDKNIGACQSKILLFNEKDRINTAGNKIHFLGIGYCGDYQMESTKITKTKDIPYVSGASMLIKKDILKEVGLLDKNYFLYHEDLELSWRIRLKGYKLMLAPNSIVYHKYSFSRNKLKNYYMERNKLIFLLEYYEFKTLLLIFPFFLLTELSTIGLSLKEGWFWNKIRGYYWIFKNLRYIFRKRKNIQEGRKIKDKELVKFISGEINFSEINSFSLNIFNILSKNYWRMIKLFI